MDDGLAFQATQSERYAAEGYLDAERRALVDYCKDEPERLPLHPLNTAARVTEFIPKQSRRSML